MVTCYDTQKSDGSTEHKFYFDFLSLQGEIKQFMQSKDVSLLEDTQQTHDLAFLTDITGKLIHLYCELQGKGKTVVDMINDLNTFEAKMNIFSVDLQRKKVLYFPSVQQVLKDNASASETFDKVAEKVLRSQKQTWARV